MLEYNDILEAVRKAKENKQDRKFKESVDLAVGLTNIDLKDPSKRFRVEVLLPHKPNKSVKLCVIGDSDVISRAQEAGVEFTLSENEMDQLVQDPKQAKAYISNIDYFLAIPQMMATVGKLMGRFLGPAGKMPTVLPPGANISDFVTRYGRTSRLRLRQNPVIHCRVGTEDMTDEEIATNIRTVLTEIENRLEQGTNNIRRAHVKTTMGPAIEIGA